MSDERRFCQERLRQEVEDLALKVVLGEGGAAAVAESLAAIGELARQAGCEPVARIASEAGQTLAGGGEAEFQGVLERLRQALEGDGAPAGPTTASVLAQDPELVTDFVVESREHLVTIERQLLDLEQNPSNLEAINAVFRGFHSIKGLAGFLELGEIQEMAHEVETVLDLARGFKLKITPGVIDVVLAARDWVAQWLRRIEAGLAGASTPAAPASDLLLGRVRALMRIEDVTREAPVPGPAPEPPRAEASGASAGRADSGGDASSLRVDTNKLDYLMDMVGELVIAQSLIRHDPALAGLANQRLARNFSQLSRVTVEVQRTAMGLRMIPVGNLFQRCTRLVRDLLRKTGKKADLVISGEDTELDKTIIEALADPLMHMLRNSVDHGVALPERRVAAGKPPVARIGLSAYHQGGQIVIEIQDDGRGLDRDKIFRAAVERGLVAPNAELSDAEMFELIFQPGFSTAAQVTEVSGRGVGMDVVRRHIQKLRGRIEIQSARHVGTTFFLKLPLTMAIIDGLVVGLGQERYIIPIHLVREVLRPSQEMVFTVQGRGEMAMVRDKLLPLTRLGARLGVKARVETAWESLLIVVESEAKYYCLMVDELIGKQEVVIKSLGETFKQVAGVAGGAILGDGRVGLILDVDGVLGRDGNGERVV